MLLHTVQRRSPGHLRVEPPLAFLLLLLLFCAPAPAVGVVKLKGARGLAGSAPSSSIGRAAEYVPPPSFGPLNASANAWPRAQSAWRRRLLKRSEAYVKELGERLKDDSPSDGILWRNLSHFNGSEADASVPWKTLCAQGVMVNPLPDPLLEWEQQNASECAPGDIVHSGIADYIGRSDVALAKCGEEQCSSIVNVGCKGTKYRICKKGSVAQASLSGSCLRLRPPGQKPSQTSTGPRAPQQTEFWRQFCAHNAQASSFRLLFPERLCSVGKVLTGPSMSTEGGCADLVQQDAECSQIFDFQAVTASAPAPICRCVAKSAKCAAGVEKKPSGNVYIIGG